MRGPPLGWIVDTAETGEEVLQDEHSEQVLHHLHGRAAGNERRAWWWSFELNRFICLLYFVAENLIPVLSLISLSILLL
jgi:hypothetical protein